MALARRLADAGYDVVIGSRDAGRAAEAAVGLGVEGATNEEACRGADLVVLATKADAAVDTARELREAIGTTPVLSVAAELIVLAPRACSRRPRRRRSRRGSRRSLDGPVIAGLHSLAARNLGGDGPPEEDVLVCGDDEEAKAAVLELAERITSGRAVDCGPLASARALEGLTAVIVNVNKRYKAHVGVRLSGLR